jgi:hypothetical protein
MLETMGVKAKETINGKGIENFLEFAYQGEQRQRSQVYSCFFFMFVQIKSSEKK